MKVYFFHGFNVRDGGANSIDKLIPYFSNSMYQVVEVDYLWAGLLGVRLCNKKLAKAVSHLIEPNSIAIGHSNGCALIHYAANYGAPFQQVVYINPALRQDKELAPQVDYAHVWHSPSDMAVKASRLSALLPGTVWGQMGAVGYTGNDIRYHNYDKENNYQLSSRSHSDVFADGKIDLFGPLIELAVKEHIPHASTWIV